MIARVLVIGYFSLYLMSSWIAAALGIDPLRALLVIVTATYLVSRLVADFEVGLPLSRFVTERTVWVTLAYTFLYCLLYFPRTPNMRTTGAITNAATLVSHTAFWAVVYSAPVYERNRRQFFDDLWLGMAVAFMAGYLFALSLVGYSLKPGAVHNLAESTPYIRSDIDVPFLAMVVGVVGVVYAFLRDRWTPWHAGFGSARSASVGRGLAFLVIGVGGLFMYSRRTPLFALVIVAFVLALPRGQGLKLIRLAVVFPLVPLFWGAVGRVLLLLTQNDLVASVLTRNDPAEYLTATNRLAVWMRSFAFIRDFHISHLWGYGGAPRYILPDNIGFTHVHNGLLQLFFDGGVLSVLVVVYLLVRAYRQLDLLARLGRYRGDATALLGVLLAWFIISAVEPSLHGVGIPSMLFLMLVVTVGNCYRESIVTPVGARLIVLKAGHQENELVA